MLATGRTAADVPTLLLRCDTAAVVSLSTYRSFGVEELRNTALAVSGRMGRVAWAVGGSTLGDSDFRESTGHAALSAYLAKRIGVGISAEFAQTRIRLVHDDDSFAASLSASAGLHAARGSIDVGVRRLATFWEDAGDLGGPKSYVATGHWLLGDYVDVVGSAQRRQEGRWSSAVGAVVGAHDRVNILLSRTSDPAGFAGGAEVTFPHLRVAYGVRTHPELDATHVVTLSTMW